MVDFLSDACISGVLSIVVVDGCDHHLFKVCDHLVPQVELLESLKCNTQPFYGLFPEPLGKPVPEEILLYGAREDNRSRHTDNPDGRHSIRTNQRPNSVIRPHFLRQMPFLLQHCHFILAWDRHQICWLAYPVAWNTNTHFLFN